MIIMKTHQFVHNYSHHTDCQSQSWIRNAEDCHALAGVYFHVLHKHACESVSQASPIPEEGTGDEKTNGAPESETKKD